MAGKFITGPADEWVDVTEQAGFDVGFFQNQSGYIYNAIEASEKPGENERGRWIQPGDEVEIDPSDLRLYVRSTQPIYGYAQERA